MSAVDTLYRGRFLLLRNHLHNIALALTNVLGFETSKVGPTEYKLKNKGVPLYEITLCLTDAKVSGTSYMKMILKKYTHKDFSADVAITHYIVLTDSVDMVVDLIENFIGL